MMEAFSGLPTHSPQGVLVSTLRVSALPAMVESTRRRQKTCYMT